MEELGDFLKGRAKNGLLPRASLEEASLRFRLTEAEVELKALEEGILPERYERNRKTISVEQQLNLFRSRVAVVGCGGLGGHIIEGLARLGVGEIVAIDNDVFVENNLNRQVLCTLRYLGKLKVDAAYERVLEINPAVKLVPVSGCMTVDNCPGLLQDCNAVVDALDSIPDRLILSDVCGRLSLPLVHGAIGGWYGQVAVQYPGDDIVRRIYGNVTEAKGVEKVLGNPSFTPAVIAGIEVAEVCKVLLGVKPPGRARMLSVNLLDMDFIEVEV